MTKAPEQPMIPIPMALLQRIGFILENLRELPEGVAVKDVVQVLLAMEQHAQISGAQGIEQPEEQPKPNGGG